MLSGGKSWEVHEKILREFYDIKILQCLCIFLHYDSIFKWPIQIIECDTFDSTFFNKDITIK